MKQHGFARWVGLLAVAVALVACGGGGGGGGGGTDGGSSAGIDRTGVTIAAGPVTGFGSVLVNGVRYDTSSATFTIDDHPGGQDDLAVGDVVVVRGTINANLTTGTAMSVTFDDAVEGPVESIGASQLVVMGQTVLVTPDTSFDDRIPGSSLSGLSPGDIVEVSGLVLATGEISATRIEPKLAGGTLEVRGRVTSLTATTFAISTLIVDYTTAQLRDLPAGGLANGQLVEVKGPAANYSGPPAQSPPVLVASEVEAKSAGFGASSGNRLEIEGFITRFASATDFDVSGSPVTTTAGTVYTGGVGLTAGDLGLNVKVEAEGQLNGSGILVASRIDIRRATSVRIFAALDSVDAANQRFTVLGIDVRADDLTRFEDKTDADVDPLRLSDLNPGEYLEVRGSEDPTSTADAIAAIVERDDADDTLLQGFVTSVTEPSFEILGVTIDTTTTVVFRDLDDSVMSREDFFAAIGPGSLVKARGFESSTTVLAASEVELELEL